MSLSILELIDLVSCASILGRNSIAGSQLRMKGGFALKKMALATIRIPLELISTAVGHNQLKCFPPKYDIN